MNIFKNIKELKVTNAIEKDVQYNAVVENKSRIDLPHHSPPSTP